MPHGDKTIMNFRIVIPSFEEKELIVAIPDKSNKSTSSLSISLAADMKMRRKQCENYRDQPITFKEAA